MERLGSDEHASISTGLPAEIILDYLSCCVVLRENFKSPQDFCDG